MEELLAMARSLRAWPSLSPREGSVCGMPGNSSWGSGGEIGKGGGGEEFDFKLTPELPDLLYQDISSSVIIHNQKQSASSVLGISAIR